MPTAYLLFSHFPFDFSDPASQELPVEVANRVRLDSPSVVHEWTAQGDRQRLRPLLFPSEVAGAGACHVCLSREILPNESPRDAWQAIWWTLLALRLAKPFPFESEAQFVLDPGSSIEGVERAIHRGRATRPDADRFGMSDLERAGRILGALEPWKAAALVRPRSGLLMFSHVSQGMVESWQLGMLGAIAALEAFFPQPSGGAERHVRPSGVTRETYSQRLARRIRAFLVDVPGIDEAAGLVERLYEAHRNGIAHGVHAAPLESGPNSERNRDLRDLLEVVRLTILGNLGLPAHELATLLPELASGLPEQPAIERRARAPDDFLLGETLLAR